MSSCLAGFFLPRPYHNVTSIFGSAEKKANRLREALRKNLQHDRSFDVTYKDDTFKALNAEIGSGVDYLVAGHTHLERAIERNMPGRYYFNSGTWIRLIQLTDEILNDTKQFDRVHDVFNQGSMACLDDLNNLGVEKKQSLVLLKPTVVSICCEGGQTYGELCRARRDGSLQSVEHTRFPRS